MCGSLAIVGALSDDDTTKRDTAVSIDVRVGGACTGSGTGTTVAGDPVVCRGGKWSALTSRTSAPATTDSETPTNMSGPLGTTFTVEGFDSEAHYTAVKTTQKTRDKWGSRPSKGTYLLVYVKAEVISGSEYVCSCSFQFVTATGKVYDAGYGDFKGIEALDVADVAAGQNRDGWVVFDVPKSALIGGRIGLKPNTFTDDVAYWTL